MSTSNVAWRKSSYSGNTQNSDCVEVAPILAAVGVRDSKDVERGHLAVPSASWSALTESFKR